MTIAANIANNADALKAYGIEVADQEGNLRSTYDVLKDLSEIWGTMTDTERVALGQVLAGKNQFKVLTSVLSNFSHAIQATETAYNSAGSAAQENAKYMESLEAKTTNLSATFQKLANDIISKELVGSILDLTNGLVGLADTGFGQVLTKAGLFAGAGFGLSQLNAVTKFLPTVISQFTNLGAVLSGTMGIASGILPILLALGVAIFGVVEAVKAFKTYQDEHTLEGIGKRFQDESAYVQEFTDKLEECKKKLEELNAVDVKDRGQEWSNEKAYLEEQIRYYEYLLNMHQQQRGEAAQEYRTADKGVGFGVTTRDDAGWDYDEEGNIVSTRTAEQQNALSATYRTEADAVLTLAQAYELCTDETEDMEAAVADLKTQLEQQYGIIVDQNIVSADYYNRLQGRLIRTNLNATRGVEELTAAQKEEQLSLLENNQILYQSLYHVDNLTDSEIAFKNAYEELAFRLSSFNSEGQGFKQGLVDIANALGILPDEAYDLAVNLGYIEPVARPAADAFVQLADGTWVAAEAISEANDEFEDGAVAVESLARASYTGSDAALQMAIELETVGYQAEMTADEFNNLVAQEIIFNNTNLDVSSKILALQQLALQAGATANAIAGVLYQAQGATKQKVVNPETGAVEWSFSYNKEQSLLDYYKKLMETIPEKEEQQHSYGGSVQKAKDEIEKNAQDTLNNVSSMTSQTIEDSANEAKEQAKKTLDAISKAVKEFYDEKINALKEQNEEIDKQVQLEEKLRALEEAKNKQILLYENGEYRYGQDLGAIAAAQKDYDKFVADMEKDAQIKVLEDTRDKILKVLEQIEANLDGYTEQQLSSITSLSTSLTSSVENITNIIGDTSSGIFATLQALLSGLDTSGSGSLDLSSLLSMFGGGMSSGTALGSGTGQTMFMNQMRGSSAEMMELALRNKLSSERQWRKGQLLSLAYQADTGIPLDVQWWMSMFEAEMSDQIRGGTGNIGAGDPRGLDPDASKHVDINYWLERIANAGDLYEAMDYYARAQAAGYVLAEFAEGYFDALGWKNFDPTTIYQDMRDAYKKQYTNNADAVLMTRFHQYYSSGQKIQSNAAGSAWYYNQNDLLSDAMWSALTGEQVYRTRSGGLGRSDLGWLYSAKAANDYEKLDADQRARYEEEARLNREYLINSLQQQIAENSAAWFGASKEEQQALHTANEYYRTYLDKIQSGDYEGLGGWNYSPIQQGLYEQQKLSRNDYTGEVTMYRAGAEAEAIAEDLVPEIADALGIPTDYGTTTGIAAQGSLLDSLGSNGTTNYNINIDNIELPGVVDSDGFITGLRNLAYQYAYTRQ